MKNDLFWIDFKVSIFKIFWSGQSHKKNFLSNMKQKKTDLHLWNRVYKFQLCCKWIFCRKFLYAFSLYPCVYLSFIEMFFLSVCLCPSFYLSFFPFAFSLLSVFPFVYQLVFFFLSFVILIVIPADFLSFCFSFHFLRLSFHFSFFLSVCYPICLLSSFLSFYPSISLTWYWSEILTLT